MHPLQQAAEEAAANAVIVQITVAVLSFLGICVTAVFGYFGVKAAKRAEKHAAEVNDAVNHRHYDEPRLFDVVKNTALEVREVKGQVAVVDKKVDTVKDDLHDHIVWESDQKYQDRDAVQDAIKAALLPIVEKIDTKEDKVP